MRIVFLMSCGTFLLSLVPAQVAGGEPRRESLRGTARLDDGSPWPGARVLLLARTPGVLGMAEDRLEVTADRSGRFLANLRVGWRYSVFAQEPQANDTERVSMVVDEVDIGMPLELVAGAARQRPSLELAGLLPWSARGVLTVRYIGTGDVPAIVDRIVPGDGRVEVPALPGLAAAVEIRCGAQPISERLPIDLRQPKTLLKVHPPREVALLVVDRNQQPVADARVSAFRSDAERRDCGSLVPLARSGKDGIARVVLPFPPDGIDQQFAPLAIDAPDISPIGCVYGFRVAADHEPTAARAFRVWCNDGQRHSVVLQREGAPLAGVELEVANLRACAGVQGAAAGGSYVRELVATGAGGEATIDCVPETTVLVTAATAALGSKLAVEGAVAPLALLGVIEANAPARRHPIDVRDLQPIRVRVTDPDGAPARDALVSVLVSGSPWRAALPRGTTDRAGRITFLVPRGLDCWLCAWNGRGSLAPDQPVSGGEALHTLQLEACASARLTITDANDPVPLAKAIFGVLAMDHVQDARLAAAVGPMCVTVDGRGVGQLPLYAGLSYSLGRVRVAGGSAVANAEIDIPRDDPAAAPKEVELRIIPVAR